METSPSPALGTAQAGNPSLGKRIAVLLVKHGRDGVVALITALTKLITSGFKLTQTFLDEHREVFLQLPVQLGRTLVLVVKYVLATPLVKKVLEVVSRLISINLSVSTNQELDDATKLSARFSSYLSLLFGALRSVTELSLKHHSYLP